MIRKTTFVFLMCLSLLANAQNSAPEVATSGTLTVSVTTSSAGGKYFPEHVMAIWIEDGSGKFVKTLLAYADKRKGYLTNWKKVNSTYNTVDAVTGATKTSHTTRTCTWNGTNVSKAQVTDGNYVLKMELTDKDATGNVGSFTFAKGTSEVTLNPTSIPSFSNISIKWTPTNTSVEDIEENNLYRIYPNPAKKYIYVTGFDISLVDIINTDGRILLSSDQQNVDVSTLKKGVYIVNIHTSKGSVLQKFIKE